MEAIADLWQSVLALSQFFYVMKYVLSPISLRSFGPNSRL